MIDIEKLRESCLNNGPDRMMMADIIEELCTELAAAREEIAFLKREALLQGGIIFRQEAELTLLREVQKHAVVERWPHAYTAQKAYKKWLNEQKGEE